MWLIDKPALTKNEFDDIYVQNRHVGYCNVITPTLTASYLADIEQLHQLSH